MRRERGVTITAMVIAIILLIILAAVSITAVRSSNRDIMQTAYDAKTGMEVASYQEELDIIEVQCASEQINSGLSVSEYLSLFKAEVEADTAFENATVEKKSSSCLRIETEEGYIFYVYGSGVDYQGIDGEITETYTITEEDVVFTYNPSDWTNGSVEVTIALDFDTEGNSYQYSYDKETWEDYTETLVVTENTKIYVMYSADNYDESYVTGEVANIDTVAPLDFTPEITDVGTSTITVAGETEDGAATATSGKSGIDHYEFSNDGGTTWYDIDDSATYDKNSDEIEFTFDGLEQGTEYVIGMKAVDVAGNETEGYVTGETKAVPDASDVLEIVYTPDLSSESRETSDGWTNEDVIVEIDVTDEETAELVEDGTYVIQYKIESDGVWRTYTKEITISENDTISVRLSDGTNNGEEITGEIDWIDQDSPDVSELEYTDVGDDYISVAVTCSDELSGISEYYYYIEQYELDSNGKENTTEVGGYSTTSSEMTFEDLENQTSYLITVTIFDIAGNYSTSDTMKISTGEITELYYTYDTSWEIGDYVDYSIDINEDGDTTNDWRIFYEDEDGNIFIIANEYLPTTSKYIDLDELLVAYTTSWTEDSDTAEEDYVSYGFSWWNLTSDSTQKSASATILSSLNSTVIDLFMNEWPYLTTSTNLNNRVCAIMMYSDLWDGLVDSSYAQYAIGSVTFEMWEAAWEAQGYDKIYYDSSISTTGYQISLDNNSYANELIVTFAAMENSGYYDDLFFPTDFSGYAFSSPIAKSTSYNLGLSSSGQITNSATDRYSDSAGTYYFNTMKLKPVVMLKSSTYLEANSEGIVELYTSNPETKEANLELYYVTDKGDTTWTNGYATVYMSLNDEEIQGKIDNGTYELQYTEEDPEDEDSWITATSSNLSLKVEENKIIYVRIYDGSRSGEYASLIINIIDKLEPEDFEMEYEVSLETIIMIGSTTDAEATEESGSSGIDYYIYEVTNESGETRSYQTEYAVTSYVITDDEFIQYGNNYTIVVKAVDKAGNITTSSTTYSAYLESQAESGDWVEYTIDLNGDGDYTNDWRMFYEDSSGNKFIIAADYVKYNATDEDGNWLIDHDAAGASYLIGKNYAYYWASVPTKQTVNSTTNSLFMANWSYSSSTYNNVKCITTLLNTSNWTNFVDSTYANYAIGSPTAEMWIDAWNDKGYTYVYTDTGTYGYYVGTTSTLDSSSFTADLSESEGYEDSLFFPHHSAYGADGTSINGYWLASPSASSNYILMRVYYDGYLNRSNVNDTLTSVRPLVSLKSSITTTYDSSTGVWKLST